MNPEIYPLRAFSGLVGYADIYMDKMREKNLVVLFVLEKVDWLKRYSDFSGFG